MAISQESPQGLGLPSEKAKRKKVRTFLCFYHSDSINAVL
jgi:hypothetical protein